MGNVFVTLCRQREPHQATYLSLKKYHFKCCSELSMACCLIWQLLVHALQESRGNCLLGAMLISRQSSHTVQHQTQVGLRTGI
jgi:hypothetical protein